MKIGVLPNLDKRGAAQAVERMGRLFKDWGYTAYLPDSMIGTDYEHLPEKEIFEVADVIITVGGDGTIIRYGKLAAKAGKPVLGVNAGRLGFLAQVEPNELELLKKIGTGE
ncbi:MAG: NAD(+)/NADH kinase, partial [Clostridia bacterium]|nr:NAD(+)/NADH kinase [Clostridia bacterium]